MILILKPGIVACIAGKFFGAGLANYRQAMPAIVPASVTMSTIYDETITDLIGNYSNNATSAWYKNNN